MKDVYSEGKNCGGQGGEIVRRADGEGDDCECVIEND